MKTIQDVLTERQQQLIADYNYLMNENKPLGDPLVAAIRAELCEEFYRCYHLKKVKVEWCDNSLSDKPAMTSYEGHVLHYKNMKIGKRISLNDVNFYKRMGKSKHIPMIYVRVPGNPDRSGNYPIYNIYLL